MKHSPEPWRWEDKAGAGIQIYARAPFKANCIEFTLRDAEQPVMALVAYEPWIQFPPKEWTEMQIANAARIVDCMNALAGKNPSGVKALVEAPQKLLTVLNADRGRIGVWPFSGEALDAAIELQAALAGIKEVKE